MSDAALVDKEQRQPHHFRCQPVPIPISQVSSTVAAGLPRKAATSDEVRSKFLNMIGIESKLPVMEQPPEDRNDGGNDHGCLSMSSQGENDTDSDSNTESMNDLTSGGGPCGQQHQQQEPPSGVPPIQPHAHGFSLGCPPSNHLSSSFSSCWQHPRTQLVSSFAEALKYDRAEDERYSPKRRKTVHRSPDHTAADDASGLGSPCSLNSSGSTSCGSHSTKPKKTLGFRETVDVVPIPMRTEYSNRVKSRIWSTAAEIFQNAARNTIEFASEGWDWRKVTEDESMYVCVATGELIHPCHYEGHEFATGSSAATMTP